MLAAVIGCFSTFKLLPAVVGSVLPLQRVISIVFPVLPGQVKVFRALYTFDPLSVGVISYQILLKLLWRIWVKFDFVLS